jgi:hypothetical protein
MDHFEQNTPAGSAVNWKNTPDPPMVRALKNLLHDYVFAIE